MCNAQYVFYEAAKAMDETIILCVDDEEIVLRSLKRELYDTLGEEYVIETAEDGEDALEVFKELLKDVY
jgi:YesN/AraC family two-component response regulator